MGPPPFSDGNWEREPMRPLRVCSFNGATAFQRWKHEPAPRHLPVCTAPSMGPTAFQRWKHGAYLVSSTFPLYPSMGPPPFSDGNWRPTPRPTGAFLTFNGATAFQRWKLSLYGQGCTDSSAFNGATAFQRWKPASTELSINSATAPSMGPPPFSDGNFLD